MFDSDIFKETSDSNHHFLKQKYIILNKITRSSYWYQICNITLSKKILLNQSWFHKKDLNRHLDVIRHHNSSCWYICKKKRWKGYSIFTFFLFSNDFAIWILYHKCYLVCGKLSNDWYPSKTFFTEFWY